MSNTETEELDTYENEGYVESPTPVSTSLEDFEALSNFGIEKENYTLTYNAEVPLSKIVVSAPYKKGRTMTIRGLTKSVAELGVVTPIHVMRLETPELAETLEDDEPEFLLIKGLRRLFASIRNGLETIPCVIWDFKDKDKGRQAALVLGLTLNRTGKRSWSEIWDLYNILEMESQIKPATFESLFQLEGGDAMKLKDVMFSEYPEIKDELLANQKSLDQCYKQLQKLRKDEDRLDIEDNLGFSDTNEQAKEVVSESEQSTTQLSNDDVLEILEMGDAFGKDITGDDFSEMSGMFNEPNYQTSKDRRPLDPALKQKILARDEYSCKCCGTHGKAFLGALVVHHIVPVHCFGENPTSNPDDEKNLITLCDSCHLVVHVIERDGRLPITQEEFNEYEYADQLRIKNILHYARIAIIAGKRKGLTDEQRKKLSKSGLRHRMPGEGYKENASGYALYKQQMDEIESLKESSAS